MIDNPLMPKYPKIKSLYTRDEDFKFTNEFRWPVIGTINKWFATEKVDGTNIRVFYDRTKEEVIIGGRTDRAQIPAPLVQYLSQLDADKAFAHMAEHDLDTMTLFGEGYGPGIQKGGSYREDQGFILFDVCVGLNTWLKEDMVTEIALKMDIPRVPVLGIWTLNKIVQYTKDGFNSRCSHKINPAEGIIAKTIEPLYNNAGKRLIIKVKTKDFA